MSRSAATLGLRVHVGGCVRGYHARKHWWGSPGVPPRLPTGCAPLHPEASLVMAARVLLPHRHPLRIREPPPPGFPFSRSWAPPDCEMALRAECPGRQGRGEWPSRDSRANPLPKGYPKPLLWDQWECDEVLLSLGTPTPCSLGVLSQKEVTAPSCCSQQGGVPQGQVIPQALKGWPRWPQPQAIGPPSRQSGPLFTGRSQGPDSPSLELVSQLI